MRRPFGIVFVLSLLLVFSSFLQAENLPPKPTQWVEDQSRVLSSGTKSALNEKLRNFEKETSNQIIVAVFPKILSDSSIEEYTQRLAQTWGIGTKEKNNGVVLFVFIQDRAMYIQVGYGLEGALPDALAKRIIENEIKPHFRNGNYDAGIMAGANAILAATRGEYKGTGQTFAGRRTPSGNGSLPGGLLFAIIIIIFFFRIMGAAGTTYGPRRRRRSYGSVWGGGLGGFGGGGGWSSGGGGGGGFSSGGGSFGGGGAGGRW